MVVIAPRRVSVRLRRNCRSAFRRRRSAGRSRGKAPRDVRRRHRRISGRCGWERHRREQVAIADGGVTDGGEEKEYRVGDIRNGSRPAGPWELDGGRITQASVRRGGGLRPGLSSVGLSAPVHAVRLVHEVGDFDPQDFDDKVLGGISRAGECGFRRRFAAGDHHIDGAELAGCGP